MKPLYTTLDGTSWELGTKKIHILTLCVVFERISIPIWWQDLDKKGISSQQERIEFMQEALKIYTLKEMILLADREYCGKEWFGFFKQTRHWFYYSAQKKCLHRLCGRV